MQAAKGQMVPEYKADGGMALPIPKITLELFPRVIR